MKEPKTYNTIDVDYRIEDVPNDNASTNVVIEEKMADTERIEIEMKGLQCIY